MSISNAFLLLGDRPVGAVIRLRMDRENFAGFTPGPRQSRERVRLEMIGEDAPSLAAVAEA